MSTGCCADQQVFASLGVLMPLLVVVVVLVVVRVLLLLFLLLLVAVVVVGQVVHGVMGAPGPLQAPPHTAAHTCTNTVPYSKHAGGGRLQCVLL